MPREKLRQIGERIGAMSLRERVFVFSAAVAVVLALVQTLLIDAGQLRKQTAHDRLQTADKALAQIAQQRQLHGRQAGHDPDRAARDALAVQQARLARLNAELEARERSLVPPERMHQVLKDVIRGQGGIRIVGFKTLSPQPVLPARGEPATTPPLRGDSSASPQAAAAGVPPGFYRHGFEITVSGRYSELVAYLERLEALPWHLNWIEATLDASARPELTLTLIVHTLSLEEAWLRV